MVPVCRIRPGRGPKEEFGDCVKVLSCDLVQKSQFFKLAIAKSRRADDVHDGLSFDIISTQYSDNAARIYMSEVLA